MKHRRQRPPQPWQPPPGKMLFYNEVVPIKTAERHAKRILAGFDKLPREQRDLINDGEIKKRRGTRWTPPTR